MSLATAELKKPLGIRATAEEHEIIKEAAQREHRSVNSFVLSAALQAAKTQSPAKPKRSPEEVQAILRAIRQEFQALHPGRDPLAELLAERRQEAERE